ncbi:hypothetical protein GCM10009735_16040 [Actinomadura chokoriensis]
MAAAQPTGDLRDQVEYAAMQDADVLVVDGEHQQTQHPSRLVRPVLCWSRFRQWRFLHLGGSLVRTLVRHQAAGGLKGQPVHVSPLSWSVPGDRMLTILPRGDPHPRDSPLAESVRPRTVMAMDSVPNPPTLRPGLRHDRRLADGQ